MPQTRGVDDAVPIRWQCPEAVLTRVYTAKSDVYSFGVLLYEIFSRSGAPYASLASSEVIRMVKAGELLPSPGNDTPEDIFRLMRLCTSLHVGQRPSMATVHAKLSGAWTLDEEPVPAGMAVNPALGLRSGDDQEEEDAGETSL